MAVVNYLAQASVSIADYRHEAVPRWELEVAVMVESGLYVDRVGKGIEEWNDLINQKDYGPTFGARIMLDLWQIYNRLKK